MLAELPEAVTTYWLAWQRLQDENYRSETYWDMLATTDPDRFQREQAELIAQYKQHSQASAA